MTLLELIAVCAPSVAPITMQEIVRVESGGNALAINVNGGRLARKARNAADAAALARSAISQGYSVDLGLMQVNSRNLGSLGYSVEDMFEPCKNLTAGARVLTNFYQAARPRYSDDQSALRAALSAYNTGSYQRGFANGYVAKYVGPQARSAPMLGALQLASATMAEPAPIAPPPPNPYQITSTVFTKRQEAQPVRVTETTKPVVSGNDDDAQTPGVQIEHTAESAERAGAFEETALSEAAAWESNTDLHSTAIVVGGKRVAAKPAAASKE